MGWYAMALVDVLELLPDGHPRRGELERILQDLSRALLACRDTTGLWYQVVDAGTRQGNYLEASASAMFAYAFAKGANRGYLGKEYLAAAEGTFAALTRRLVTVDENGFVDLHETCRGAGLGGHPYRDGSYEYYISEPRRTNDMKGYGPLLLAAIEIEKAVAVEHR
jgi:unsaturated rhamnogalacturonyl hydrolase